MENALLIGLSRQMVLRQQLDVVANNLANVNTTGFKADNIQFEEYLSSPARDDSFVGQDRRISFVQERGNYRDLTQGPVQHTGNALDLAIDGGAFFTVQTPAGERYTRDGAFQINERGEIVTLSGHAVLGANGPIILQPSDRDITISADGTLTVRESNTAAVDAIRGRLRVVNFAQPQTLVREGENLFSASAGLAQTDTTAKIRQGFLEKSNVNAVAEMSRMIGITRAYSQVASLLQQQGDLRRGAIEKLADVPA